MNRGRSPAMRLVAESFMPPIDPTIDRAYGAAAPRRRAQDRVNTVDDLMRPSVRDTRSART